MTPTPAFPTDLYKAYLEDLGRIGGRHENARQFYMSVVSALFVFLALAGEAGILAGVPGPVLRIGGVAGIVVCAAWFEHMRSFAALYRAKLHTLCALEAGLALQPFTIEAGQLFKRGSRGYTPLTTVDRIVPVAIGILFVFLMVVKSRG